MLTIHFVNDGTGDQETGNYDVTVVVNGQVIAKDRVQGHKRARGWSDLVRMLGEQHYEGCGCLACRGL